MKIRLLILFYMLFTTNSTSAYLPTLGIKDGDSFEFTIDKYQRSSNGIEDEAPSLPFMSMTNQSDFTRITLSENAEFTITIHNSTIYRGIYGGNLVDFELSYQNQSVMLITPLNITIYGMFISETNWMEKNEYIKNLNDRSIEEGTNEFGTTLLNYELINNDYEWGFSNEAHHFYDTAFGSYESTRIYEVIYEKSTGMMIYYKRTEVSDNIRNGIEIHSEMELIISRKGYSTPSADKSLPNSSFLFMIGVFSIIQLSSTLKKHKSIDR